MRIEDGPIPIQYLPASDGMLVKGKRHYVPSPKKTGKSLSWLRHTVDMILAAHAPLILDRENGADLYANRLALILAAERLTDEQRAQVRAGLAYYEFPKIRDHDRADLTAEMAGADLVIFDSQRRFLSDLGLDEDSSDDYAKFAAATIDVLFEAGIATLIQDNTGHQDQTRGRGTSAKADLNEVSFVLETVEAFSEARVGKIRLRLEPGGSRFGNEGTWDMTIGAGVFGPWERASPDNIAAEHREEQRQDALTWIVTYVKENPGAAKTDVEEAFAKHHGRGGRSLARRLIDAALDASQTASTPLLAKGKGPAANGVYLYPALQASLPLAEPTNGEHGDQASGPTPGETARVLAAALTKGGERRALAEGDISDAETDPSAPGCLEPGGVENDARAGSSP